MHGPRERHQMIGGDHLGLCKFTRDEEEDVRDVVSGGIAFLMETKKKAIGG